MKYNYAIKINFKGGIISPGELLDILVAAERAGITNVKFGLRQQLLIDYTYDSIALLQKELDALGILYEIGKVEYPNIVSSYPAEEVFITKTWLSEGVYKDIFDAIDFQPKLKINISDSNQSFTPLLTGNINWVASVTSQHFWHLFIRFPKTNIIQEYSEMVYTNDIAKMSKRIEELIFQYSSKFYDTENADGELLFEMLKKENFITQKAITPAKLPAFNLPYYEGLNRYNDKFWLGIYRRNELFTISFLKDVCKLCLTTKIGLLCSTPWKTIIVKSIEEKDKEKWNKLLAKHKINVRHAANELNFQVEDNCNEGLELKNYLLQHFHKDDTRTFGICIGIKTRKKGEVFSSILVRRKAFFSILGFEFFHTYDILCAEEFNPNKRTGFIFSQNNPKNVLAEQLRRAIFSFQVQRQKSNDSIEEKSSPKKEASDKKFKQEFVYQCTNCLTVYDDKNGEPEIGIPAGTSFESLPDKFNCILCEASKDDFVKKERSKFILLSI